MRSAVQQRHFGKAAAVNFVGIAGVFWRMGLFIWAGFFANFAPVFGGGETRELLWSLGQHYLIKLFIYSNSLALNKFAAVN